MVETWPNENEIYINAISGEFVSIDCMGKTLTFFTPSSWKKGQNKKMLDTFWFLSEYDPLVI